MFARRESRSPSAAIEPEVKFAADEDSPESAGAKKEASEVGIGSSSELLSGSDICISCTGDGTGEFSCEGIGEILGKFSGKRDFIICWQRFFWERTRSW